MWNDFYSGLIPKRQLSNDFSGVKLISVTSLGEHVIFSVIPLLGLHMDQASRDPWTKPPGSSFQRKMESAWAPQKANPHGDLDVALTRQSAGSFLINVLETTIKGSTLVVGGYPTWLALETPHFQGRRQFSRLYQD